MLCSAMFAASAVRAQLWQWIVTQRYFERHTVVLMVAHSMHTAVSYLPCVITKFEDLHYRVYTFVVKDFSAEQKIHSLSEVDKL